MDPRELAQAEEKIKGLLKENDLLKVSLDQEKAKPAAAADAKALAEARQALAEANRKLAEQTKNANALALERTALQTKLNNLTPSPANAAALEATRKALEDANRKLAEQAKLASAAALEKETLQARLKALQADAEAATALRAENQLLKKQLADLKAAPPPTTKAEEASRQLAQAQAQVATLQSDKEMLQLEKMALENRVKQLSAPPAAPAVTPPLTKTAEASRIKQLERERDELQKQLDGGQQGALQPQEQGGGSPPGGPRESIGHAAARSGVRGAASALYGGGIGLIQAAGNQTRPGGSPRRREIGQGTAPRHGGARGRGATRLRQQTARQG